MALILAALGLGAGWLYRTRAVHAISATDTVVLADFNNSTNDPVFDETLQQALATDLEQSPYLRILPNQTVNATLRQMSQKPGTRLTADIARQVCMRAASKAYFTGSIANLGSQYLIGLKAVNCQTGELLSQANTTVNGKEEVLKALHATTDKLRENVGESLASIQKLGLPLQASTPSLEAWQNYSAGRKVLTTKAAVPLFQHAIQLDPKFAMAHLSLGLTYLSLNQDDLAAESIGKAFALRDQVSEWEKFAIESRFYFSVTGDLEKARAVYQAWALNYPLYPAPVSSIGSIDVLRGEYANALAQGRLAVQLSSGAALQVCNLTNMYLNSNLLQDAKSTAEEEILKRPNSDCAHEFLYMIAFSNT